jgi:RNA polymerase sigma-70 factor (ECF subfamily)
LKEKFLVRELRNGNASAFEQLYLHYYDRLHNFSLRLTGSQQDAEGLVQDVFTAVWENREKLDEEKSFSGFIFRIARNKFLNVLKQKVTHRVFLKYTSGKTGNHDLRMEVEAVELDALIRKAIGDLPAKTRNIFILSRHKGLTYKEIALELDLSENVVDHEIRKALKSIQEKLSDYFS